jgi:hypothetical protein
LTVSPGAKAGMSSRSDALSTMSSVFIAETLPRGSRLPTGPHAGARADGNRADGFGHIVASCGSVSRRAPAAESTAGQQLLNCARRDATSEIVQIAAGRSRRKHPDRDKPDEKADCAIWVRSR